MFTVNSGFAAKLKKTRRLYGLGKKDPAWRLTAVAWGLPIPLQLFIFNAVHCDNPTRVESMDEQCDCWTGLWQHEYIYGYLYNKEQSRDRCVYP